MSNGNGGGIPWPVWAIVTLGAALITAYAAFVGGDVGDNGSEVVNPSGGGGGNGYEDVEPEGAQITIEVRPSTDPSTEIETKVQIDDQHIGTLYSYQGPHQVDTDQFSEGEHTYSLELTGYASNGQVAWVITGAGTISVDDGERFRVLYDESNNSAYLSPMS